MKIRTLLFSITALFSLSISARAIADPKDNESAFAGLKFGIGVSLTSDYGKHSRVNEAEIINGTVRVKDEDNYPIRLLLESHYFFPPSSSLFGVSKENWGWGPFMAIQPGEGSIIDAFAVGLMLGLKKPGENNGSSWNFGMGLVIDPKVKTLGDGFSPNQLPPAGETEVRYTNRAQAGFLLMTSFSW